MSAGLALLKLFQMLRSYHASCTMGDTDVNKTLFSASKGLPIRGRGQTYPPKTSIIHTTGEVQRTETQKPGKTCTVRKIMKVFLSKQHLRDKLTFSGMKMGVGWASCRKCTALGWRGPASPPLLFQPILTSTHQCRDATLCEAEPQMEIKTK